MTDEWITEAGWPKGWREGLPEPPSDFDPDDPEQVEALLKMYNVTIEEDNSPTYPGWGVLYKGGGGVMCPFLRGDTDGKRARAVIALSVYLHVVGVNVALCDRIAYWFIQGPYLAPRSIERGSKQEESPSAPPAGHGEQ